MPANHVLVITSFVRAQSRHQAAPHYMETIQRDTLKPHMRATLVDWLAEVADEFKLVSETLYLCAAPERAYAPRLR